MYTTICLNYLKVSTVSIFISSDVSSEDGYPEKTAKLRITVRRKDLQRYVNTVGTRTVDVTGIFSFQRADDQQERVLSKEQLGLLVEMYGQREFLYQCNYYRKTKIMQGIFQFL